PGQIGEAGGVDFDHRQVGQLVRTDHFGRQLAAVTESDLDAGGILHDVVVGNDVAVGRNNDAAAQPLLEFGAAGELAAELTKELGERVVGRQSLLAAPAIANVAGAVVLAGA